MSGRAVGIDLGTSNSVVSVVIDGEAIVIPDADERTIQPSVVSFLPDGRSIVGKKAKSRMVIDPGATIYSAKRLVGRPVYAAEIKVAMDKYAYRIVRGDDDNPKIEVRGRQFGIEEIQATILKHMKSIAEEYLGEPVTRAVITVPANFNESQRRATKVAGQLAGLEVMRILNEPTAAALAYGYDRAQRERIAVYDFGGGTFDITVLELRDNVFEVLSTAGDTFLGGDDFDLRIIEIIADEFRRQHGYDMREEPSAMQRLKSVAERLKIDLSEFETASATIRQRVPEHDQPVEFYFTITRSEFAQACHSIVQQSFLVCDEALKLASCSSGEIDRLVLVGGTTRVPTVREMVENYFFKKPLTDINPDEVVAIGAAIYAFGIEEQEAAAALPPVHTMMGLGSIAPGGPNSPGGPPPLPGGGPPPPPRKGPPPAPGTQAMTAIGSPGMATPPSSAAAPPSGTAPSLFAAQPTGPRRAAPLLIDVTPHALGVATLGDVLDVVIERNLAIPNRSSRTFATSRDDQDTVTLAIYEGESRKASDNRLLGELSLFGIRPAARGQVKIEVTFAIDNDGMLNVSARDSSTGQVQQTRLNVAGGPSAELQARASGNFPASLR